MFDEVNQNQKKAAPPSNVPAADVSEDNSKIQSQNEAQNSKPVEDIFGEEDSQPIPQEQNQDNQEHDFGIDSLEIQEENKKKFIILMSMFVGLVAIGWGTYFVFSKIVKKVANVNEIETPEIIQEKKEEVEELINDVVSPLDTKESGSDSSDALQEEEEEEVKDTDRDGLSDEEEKALNMDINSADTDSDGLFDREEVKIYKTDPLSPDTDKDGFLDGEEVKAGYNPLGAGRILNINRNKN